MPPAVNCSPLSLHASRRVDGLQITTGQSNIDELIFLASGVSRLAQALHERRCCNAPQSTLLNIVEQLLLDGGEVDLGAGLRHLALQGIERACAGAELCSSE